MKNLLSAVCVLISAFCYSQDCKNYYYLQNNKTIEMTIYDKKGSESGKNVYTISGFKGNAAGASANVNSEMFDKKGKTIAKSVSFIKCAGGVMMMDMKMNMPAGQAAQVGQTDATAQNFYLEYPSSMKEGDVLKDGNMDMDIQNKGMKQSLSMSVNNRKVEGKEKITTTAGTWDCFKITNQTKMKIKTMGIGIPMNMDVTEWYAPGFGVVKSSSKYGETVITSIK